MDSSTIRAATKVADPVERVAALCDLFLAYAEDRPHPTEQAIQELYWESYFALEAIYKREHLDVIFMGKTGYDIDPAEPATCYEFIRRTFLHTRGRLKPILEKRSLRERFEAKRKEVHGVFGVSLPPTELPAEAPDSLQLLYGRARTLLARGDYAGVVHACASMLELQAKLVCGDPLLFNKSLGTFLNRYKQRSLLNAELVTYIEQVFKARNRIPGAGHGSPGEYIVDRATAVMLVEFCVALLRVEHQLESESQLPQS